MDKLGREVQVSGRPHCPKEDSLAALDLYRLVWHEWEKSVADFQNSQQAAWAMPLPVLTPEQAATAVQQVPPPPL